MALSIYAAHNVIGKEQTTMALPWKMQFGSNNNNKKFFSCISNDRTTIQRLQVYYKTKGPFSVYKVLVQLLSSLGVHWKSLVNYYNR